MNILLAKYKLKILILILSIVLVPSYVLGKVIKQDTVWSGKITVDEDVYVPVGVVLTIQPGTEIKVLPSEGSKTDPEFVSPRTEIMVRGTLLSNGNSISPVSFSSAGEEKYPWEGLIIDGGKAVLNSIVVSNAETGLNVIGGQVKVEDSRFLKNRYGISVLSKDANVSLDTSVVEGNDYGMVLLHGARIVSRDSLVRGNRKKDRHSFFAKKYWPEKRLFASKSVETVRVFNDEVILGEVIWRGTVKVNGIVRVPRSSRLIISPGTTVEFSKKDTNGDGIGENGLFIQGKFIAKGTAEEPIVFRSSEKDRGMHDWDSINILNSDTSQNIIEYCQIENAYRGMHFHFANVAVKDLVLKNNFRAIQFQESVVEISRTHIYGNKSVMWARDSEITFTENLVYQNFSGINLFRNAISFKNNLIVNNVLEGLRVREGLPVVEGNFIYGNRYGMMIVDTVYGTFSRNVISDNMELGISLRGPVNISITDNVIERNGINGIRVLDSSAVIKGNLIADNGERGIGVLSFHGTVTGNNITGNGLYNLGIDGAHNVSASMNWWGEGDTDLTIFDKADDPSKGKAEYTPLLDKPVVIQWPLKNIFTDTIWKGSINVSGPLTVMPGAELYIAPKTSVLFSDDAGLSVNGKISARGKPGAPVVFAAAKGKGVGTWDEIYLDRAMGSVFQNCTVQDAKWALHVHFTDLKVEGCEISNNYGGMRFKGGPVNVSMSYFKGNDIGFRSYRAKAFIENNIITGNRIGFFVREKGSGLTIRNNNIYGNSDYNIRVGDFNTEDVDAMENWWGDGTPEEKLFDGRREPGVGIVKYEPYADSPFYVERLMEIEVNKTEKRAEEIKE